jgi:general secretion pathway protein D
MKRRGLARGWRRSNRLAMVIAAAGLAVLAAAGAPAQERDDLDITPVGRAPIPQPDDAVPENRQLTGGAAATEPIDINFDEAPLSEVVESIGRQTGRNFQADPQTLQQPVTIIAYNKVPGELAYQVLESVLASYNLKLVETIDGNLVKIVPAGDLQDKNNLVIGDTAPDVKWDTHLTYIVPIQYANAADLATILPSLGSTNARIDVYDRTNTLIINDTADGIGRMLTFLEQVDIPGYDQVMEVFMLQYTRAEILVDKILSVLEGTGEGGQPGVPTQPRRAVRPPVPGQPQPIIAGAAEFELRIVPDERLNALIVVGSEGQVEEVRRLVERLDVEPPRDANNMHVYNLLYAEAEDMVDALSPLLDLSPQEETQQAGAGPTGEVQPFEKRVIIQAYNSKNALLIIASPQDYARLRELIAQLDVPQRQVNVQAIIMDVAINDSFTLNVEAAGLTANDAFALNNVIDLANALTQGPLALAGQGGIFGVLDGTTEITVPDGAGGLTTQEIPNVPLLIRAIETLSDLDVLSQPSLTTVDKEEASILVGQSVPFITGRSSSLDQPAVGRSVFSNVDNRDVGIQLDVTPQISEGDMVLMELVVEVSDTIPSPIGQDVNLVGPTVQKSTVTNKVVVQDGSTGIIGGLISEDRDRSVNQTPVLGDLPLVGWLFRANTSRRSKRNLVVLVTPHILKEGRDMERITQYRVGEFRERNVDILFEQNIIKKLKRKADLRKTYRPSVERSDRILREGGFSRGGMERP